MEIEFDPEFRRQYDRLNVRIQKQLKIQLRIFERNPKDLQLHNHDLKREWLGFKSIDIANVYRAIYQVRTRGTAKVAYFVALGTHEELYGN